MLSDMLNIYRQQVLLAALLLTGTFAAGPVAAGYMDFTVASVQGEETPGC